MQKRIKLIFESESDSCSVVSASLRPHGLYSPWIEPRSPALWVDSIPGEPQGKPIFKSSIILPSTYISVHVLCVCEHIVFRNVCVCVQTCHIVEYVVLQAVFFSI